MTSSKTIPTRRKHPGRGGKRARYENKGRQVRPTDQADIRALLGGAPRDRDLLIEHLHLVQDRYGHISAGHLAALADEMRLSMAEVYEVATFYAHFDVVKEGEEAPPPLTVRVCDSLTCEMMGAGELLTSLKEGLGDQVRVLSAPCMGRCECAPVAEVGHRHITNATPDKVKQTVSAGSFGPELPKYRNFDDYRSDGGYALLNDCLAGKHSREDIIATLDDSGLRGLGGAGFPTGRKWGIVRAESGPRMMAVNADEGEPGTFKDRIYLETDPHRTLEGMLIGAWAVEADAVYFYLRDEYPQLRDMLIREIALIEDAGFSGLPAIHLRRGAGAYICGEESAMLESIEGKRGEPRHKPPFPAQVGLFGRPTLINNVETLHWVRDIVERGADWFASQGAHGRKGLRSYSVSGRVAEPGMKLAPAGTTVQELIDNYCGGMADGHSFSAYLPGGASGGILPARMADIPLDFGTLEEHGCFIGSAAVIVLSDKDDVRSAALNLTRFFEDESCGQCTPCRAGTEKAAHLMASGNWDKTLLDDLCSAMADASICGLGQAAPNPIRSVFRYFPEDAS